MRRIFALTMLLAALVAPGVAQGEPAPWQAVVSGQIAAFRAQDGAAALGFAGQGFRMQFAGEPEMFDEAIAAAGYGAIGESRTHSFGAFNRISETAVLQVVTFVGADQLLYEAVYQLADEPDEGWRVQGVVMRRAAGLGI
ncbi:DUF4864 domain-containing protein [Devosia ginsengisoli]|uniref:DUF4864 domain-containing protein n=1 Tax=Devosia ginsengisoli TaxID=400770 RepID=UPI0026EB8876|nr:DUF4864 domain-containing protein [Devosia ginsengisoli]MCR6673915.1 DUF4864 domain-containing protein [Devosia ginsengisoli]